MVTAAPKLKHTHIFEIKGHIGTCPCGEQREYIEAGNLKDSTFRVIRAGDPNYVDPPGALNSFITPPVSKPAPVTASATSETEQPKGDTVPPKPHNRSEITAYYKANKARILADFNALGNEGVKAKWQISDGTWIKLKREWLGDEAINKVYAHRIKMARERKKAGMPSSPEEKPAPEPAAEKTGTPAMKVGDIPQEPKRITDPDIAISMSISWKFFNSLNDQDFCNVWAAIGVIFRVKGRKMGEVN